MQTCTYRNDHALKHAHTQTFTHINIQNMHMHRCNLWRQTNTHKPTQTQYMDTNKHTNTYTNAIDVDTNKHIYTYTSVIHEIGRAHV